MSKKEKDIESRIEGKPNLKGSPDEVCKIWSNLRFRDRIKVVALFVAGFANGLGAKNNTADPDKDDFIVRQ